MVAQLEDAGYVHQPHTSAGRVPTDLGYRVFVDSLLEARRPSRPPANVENRILQQAGRSPLIDDLLANVSHVVSRAARQVGFAMAVNDGAVLQRIEFVPLSDTRVLVVVVSNNGQVTQKAVDLDEFLSSDDLAHAARLSEHRVRRPAAARGARRGDGAAARRSGRCTTSCWPVPCGWRRRRSTRWPDSSRSTWKAPPRSSATSARRRQRWPRCARCSR